VTVERCPACRGRLTPEPACPRCGCDLGLVRRAEAQARQRLARGLRALAQGDARQARALAQASLRLVHSPLAARVLQALGPPHRES
jgi:hypothetical protein